MLRCKTKAASGVRWSRKAPPYQYIIAACGTGSSRQFGNLRRLPIRQGRKKRNDSSRYITGSACRSASAGRFPLICAFCQWERRNLSTVAPEYITGKENSRQRWWAKMNWIAACYGSSILLLAFFMWWYQDWRHSEKRR